MNSKEGTLNNFERGKREVIKNALNTLERMTSLKDAELDIIRAMIQGDTKHEVIEFMTGEGPYRSGRKARKHIITWYEFLHKHKEEQ